MERHKYCSQCGLEYNDKKLYPRYCHNCHNFEYANPLPVVVILTPIKMVRGYGLIVIRRGEDPGKGKLALPGGFVDHNEDCMDAAKREMFEETNIPIYHMDLGIFEVRSSDTKRHIIIFTLTDPIEDRSLPHFKPNLEVQERLIITKPQEMAFPSHTDVVEEFFKYANKSASYLDYRKK